MQKCRFQNTWRGFFFGKSFPLFYGGGGGNFFSQKKKKGPHFSVMHFGLFCLGKKNIFGKSQKKQKGHELEQIFWVFRAKCWGFWGGLFGRGAFAFFQFFKPWGEFGWLALKVFLESKTPFFGSFCFYGPFLLFPKEKLIFKKRAGGGIPPLALFFQNNVCPRFFFCPQKKGWILTGFGGFFTYLLK